MKLRNVFWKIFSALLLCASFLIPQSAPAVLPPKAFDTPSNERIVQTQTQQAIEIEIETLDSDQGSSGAFLSLSKTVYADYNYNMLALEKNASGMQRLYADIDALAEHYENGGGNVSASNPFTSDSGIKYYELSGGTFSGADYGLGVDEMATVYAMYRADRPEMFFLPGTYLFSQNQNKLYIVTTEHFLLESERIRLRDIAISKANAFVSSIPKNATDYEIAILAHDSLADDTFYRYDSDKTPSTHPFAHSITGWIDSSGVVCEGYARAYQYLLSFCNVECIYVVGHSGNTAHAWNAVKCDGEWFWVDTTYDDQASLPSGRYHYYFGLPNSVFLEDHTPGDQTHGLSYQPPVPEISNDYSNFYYYKTGAFADVSDSQVINGALVKSAQRAFDNKTYCAAVYVENTKSKSAASVLFGTSSNITSAIKDAGLSLRCSSTYRSLTVSSTDTGNGGCLFLIVFELHPYDVDQNTFVESADATLILNALCHNIAAPDRADIDGDGKITVYDAVLVFKTIQ